MKKWIFRFTYKPNMKVFYLTSDNNFTTDIKEALILTDIVELLKYLKISNDFTKNFYYFDVGCIEISENTEL